MDQKTAIVSGAPRGIGLVIPKQVLDEGREAAMIDRDAEGFGCLDAPVNNAGASVSIASISGLRAPRLQGAMAA